MFVLSDFLPSVIKFFSGTLTSQVGVDVVPLHIGQ
jgi:hypothetical protein